MQTQAHLLGHVERLTDKEIELASAYNLRPGPIERRGNTGSAVPTRRTDRWRAQAARPAAKKTAATSGKPIKKAPARKKATPVKRRARR